mmetsp:Transcript_23503/g.69607  ORF Transcript_23503/g.69607 Transcript_23503/m.69607 type:complete len:338 (-) Transcript_23503:876-1889(-)
MLQHGCGVLLVLALLGWRGESILSLAAEDGEAPRRNLQECSAGKGNFTKTLLAAMDVPWLGMSVEFFRVQIEVDAEDDNGGGGGGGGRRSLPLVLVEGDLTRLPDFRQLQDMDLAGKTPAEQYGALSGGEEPPYALLRAQHEIEEALLRSETSRANEEEEDSGDYYRGRRRLNGRDRDSIEGPVEEAAGDEREDSADGGRRELEKWLGAEAVGEKAKGPVRFEEIDENWDREETEDDGVRLLKRRFRLGRFYCRLLTDDLEAESPFRAFSMVGTHRAAKGDEVSNGLDYWSDGTMSWTCLSRQSVENGVGFLVAWGALPRLRVKTGHNLGTYLWCSR